MPAQLKTAAAVERLIAMERALRNGDRNVARVDLDMTKDLDQALEALHERDTQMLAVIEESRRQKARAEQAEAQLKRLQKLADEATAEHSWHQVNNWDFTNTPDVLRRARKLVHSLYVLAFATYDL